MLLPTFIASVNGRAVDEDGYYGAQCADLILRYVKLCWPGHPRFEGDAAGWSRQVLHGFIWIDNGPHNAPGRGDVIVWDGRQNSVGVGVLGHTSICVVADENVIVGFDQNWDAVRSARLVIHSYSGVAGWHHPMG